MSVPLTKWDNVTTDWCTHSPVVLTNPIDIFYLSICSLSAEFVVFTKHFFTPDTLEHVVVQMHFDSLARRW